MEYNNILTERHGAVGLIRLNRPQVHNALNDRLMTELGTALRRFESNSEVRAMVITGNEKAFAAGADIGELQHKTFVEAYLEDVVTANWEEVTRCRKPVIAAVAGLALGGGCELAMMCDLIIAAETARFGQPEIKLGTLPGAGGTQRLTRAVGKAKAMDLCLTGRTMGAEEAERCGLVSRVVPTAALLEEAMQIATLIAGYSEVAVKLNKEAVNLAFETTLNQGVKFERRLLHASFATADQKEGMQAFTQKREPRWAHR
ncbi:enoyl-CoA hydratase [Pseudomonas sp. MTM4]|uniref:enoyl-CoA hydratase n=1 Tax=unclassified Pseudomonas TaxID=196821 RepID=UPI00103F2061|nr:MULTISPECIES: enoyl-CoA hydratase [unclassified Pseudomonas]MBC8649625.1 enoyl-CoA hydratase [Pseudomonas sp. MT4]QXY90951.1 enoyl-CoA hydratase [Pseudomonas sp. MTM4]TCD19150.1 enoyl-CoA hydratase [Pseudomonas sp. IC_126]